MFTVKEINRLKILQNVIDRNLRAVYLTWLFMPSGPN